MQYYMSLKCLPIDRRIECDTFFKKGSRVKLVNTHWEVNMDVIPHESSKQWTIVGYFHITFNYICSDFNGPICDGVVM